MKSSVLIKFKAFICSHGGSSMRHLTTLSDACQLKSLISLYTLSFKRMCRVFVLIESHIRVVSCYGDVSLSTMLRSCFTGWGLFAGVFVNWMMMIKVVKLDCVMSRLCWHGILTYWRVASPLSVGCPTLRSLTLFKVVSSTVWPNVDFMETKCYPATDFLSPWVKVCHNFNLKAFSGITRIICRRALNYWAHLVSPGVGDAPLVIIF